MFEVLLLSSDDMRFLEFQICFSIIFGVSVSDIMADYNELLKMVTTTKDHFKELHWNVQWINFTANDYYEKSIYESKICNPAYALEKFRVFLFQSFLTCLFIF